MKNKQSYQWQEMTLGTCYYPEHWDKGLWAEDLDRMKEIGISTIRIGEFAWSKIEPEEGRFTFDFFDEFLDLCDEKGMKVIFGTPTATPPAWLTEKYPEVLNCDRDGRPYFHGGRRHYTYNSLIYQYLSARIAEQAASHYASHPAIVGWQIDNELNCEISEFYSKADSDAFRLWARDKYGTLDVLNEAWGTTFWNQTYTAWDQIYVPRPGNPGGVNPHVYLDYYRFISDSAIRFCKMQVDIIRRYKKPGDFVTTNGKFGNLDNHRMAREQLDIFTYDSYPNFAHGVDDTARPNLLDRHWSKNLTEVRSICPHFGIMEQQAGAGSWVSRTMAPSPRPGQMSLWAMMSVAHGADYISFFRWRTCVMGTEIYWHGILDYDNRDNRRVAELKDFYRKLKSLDPVCGAKYTAAFGLLKDYDNDWDTNVDVWHRRFLDNSEEEIFVASEVNHTPYNIIDLRDDSFVEDLAPYPVLFYPHPTLINEARVAVLRAYVEQGGTLILGCRSGYKDMTGRCVMMPQPGLLQAITGSDVTDFTFTSPEEEPVWADWDGQKLETPIFNDILTPLEGTKVLASYANNYYAGAAALTERRVGKGRVLHLGSTFSRENMRQLLAYTGVLEPFAGLVDAPETVEVIQREKDGRRFLFLLNYLPQAEEITLKQTGTLLYTGEKAEGSYTIPAYGTAVFEV